MKLQTSIAPRRDGTVVVRTGSGASFVFSPDASGALVGEVACEDTAAALLAGGHFFPADPADGEAALALVRRVADDDSDDDGDDDDDEADQASALPVEANTPPAPARVRKPRR